MGRLYVSNVIKKNIREDRTIPGGYILLSRKIIESEIFKKPPLYLKVWIYILSKAQHQNFKQLERGELWITIADIQEGCSWYVGFRKETPTKDQIYRVLEWLRFPHEHVHEDDTNEAMIATTRATRGLHVKVLNYSVYQDPSNYERNNETNNEKSMTATRTQIDRDTINKNVKNDKNDKNVNIYSEVVPYKQIIDHLNQRTGRSFRVTDTYKKHINARFNEGFSLEDFKTVIDKKCFEWTGTKMEQYLRPQTLFGTKFDGYLNTEPIKRQSNNIFLDMLERGEFGE